MKKIRITYYISTAIMVLMMTYSAYAYLTQPAVQQTFTHLGYPDYFRIELAIAKVLGAIILIVPIAEKLKEWAYAGFAITFMSAFIAHIASRDPAVFAVMPLVFLGILAVSYITFQRVKGAQTQGFAPNSLSLH